MSKDYEPKMHSAEHLLNQTMVRLFGCERCFSAHLNKKKSKCDYRFDKPLTDDDITIITTMVNAQITADLPVRADLIPRETAAALYNLGRLPDDAITEVRIVRIGEYDACPCIGEHVSRTGEIGTFAIISHDFTEGVLRLRFKLSPV